MTATNQVFQKDLPGTDDIVRRKLANGIVVLVRENFSAQSVVVTGSIECGALLEPVEKKGLVNFLGSMLTRGTINRSFSAFHDEIETLGANLHINGGMHGTSFGGKSLGEDFSTLLTLLGDGLRYPAFPIDQTERLRGELLTYIKMRLQNPRYMAGRRFRELAYPENHPYHFDTTGTIESISSLSTEDLSAFHSTQCGPHGMIITVVGNIKAEDAVAEVEHVFGDWENPTQIEVPHHVERPPLPNASKDHTAINGKSQVDVVLGVLGPSRRDEDFQAVRMANNILGMFGMYGRLGKKVREEHGLAYYCYSQVEGGFGPGTWRASAGIDPVNYDLAVQSILAEIQQMVDIPVSEEDLADNKANLIGSLPLQLESNEGVAGSIYNMERYELGLDYLRNYADMVSKITLEDVQRVMAIYWGSGNHVVTSAGPQLNRED